MMSANKIIEEYENYIFRHLFSNLYCAERVTLILTEVPESGIVTVIYHGVKLVHDIKLDNSNLNDTPNSCADTGCIHTNSNDGNLLIGKRRQISRGWYDSVIIRIHVDESIIVFDFFQSKRQRQQNQPTFIDKKYNILEMDNVGGIVSTKEILINFVKEKWNFANELSGFLCVF